MQDKDQLEQFVSDHKAKFDSLDAPKGTWDKISSDLDRNIASPKVKVLWYWKAAVIVLLAAVTFLVVDRYNVPAVEVNETLSAVTEFEELETFYTSIISKKEIKLEEAIREDEALNYLESDIEQLELLYQDLRKLYVEQQATPEVHERLMHLLRQRLHLINSQLDIIAKEKQPEEMRLNTDLSM